MPGASRILLTDFIETSVNDTTRSCFQQLGIQLKPIKDLKPDDHLAQFTPDFQKLNGTTDMDFAKVDQDAITFEKLRFWLLTEYDQIIAMDTDIYFRASIYDLIHKFWNSNSQFAAVEYPYHGCCGQINAGLMLLRPSSQEYEKLNSAMPTATKHRWTDQKMLEWYWRGKTQHLPYTTAYDQQAYEKSGAASYDMHEKEIRAIHMKGTKATMFKPWDGEACYDMRQREKHGPKDYSRWESETLCKFVAQLFAEFEQIETELTSEMPACGSI